MKHWTVVLVCTCTYTHLPTLILISFGEEDWTVEGGGGGAWGGDSEVLEMVTSEVMKLVKSTPPKSLKSNEGSMAT